MEMWLKETPKISGKIPQKPNYLQNNVPTNISVALYPLPPNIALLIVQTDISEELQKFCEWLF